MARDKGVIWVGREEGLFLRTRLDRPNQLDGATEFRLSRRKRRADQHYPGTTQRKQAPLGSPDRFRSRSSPADRHRPSFVHGGFEFFGEPGRDQEPHHVVQGLGLAPADLLFKTLLGFLPKR